MFSEIDTTPVMNNSAGREELVPCCFLYALSFHTPPVIQPAPTAELTLAIFVSTLYINWGFQRTILIPLKSIETIK